MAIVTKLSSNEALPSMLSQMSARSRAGLSTRVGSTSSTRPSSRAYRAVTMRPSGYPYVAHQFMSQKLNRLVSSTALRVWPPKKNDQVGGDR